MYIPIKSASGITLVTLETRLLMERKIYLEGEINEASAASFQQQMQYLALEDPHKPVHLYLNSNGGQVNAGLRIYDILKGTGLELTIWCTGMAASMAAILLAGGPKGRRFILPHSQVMIHEPLISGRCERQRHFHPANRGIHSGDQTAGCGAAGSGYRTYHQAGGAGHIL